MNNLFISAVLLPFFLTFLMACRPDSSKGSVTSQDAISYDTTIKGEWGMKEPVMTAEQIIAEWPAKPKEIASAMIEKYGQPDASTDRFLIWYDNGPWKKTIAGREEIPHDFPMPHTDILEQFIDYRVPVDKYDDLAEYDGSVMTERTKGVLSARCDKEEMNFLALNLAHDIITGKKSVQEARDFYVTTVKAFKDGVKDPYTQGLQFTVSTGNTGDKDKPAKM